jgi:hypothetical protein
MVVIATFPTTSPTTSSHHGVSIVVGLTSAGNDTTASSCDLVTNVTAIICTAFDVSAEPEPRPTFVPRPRFWWTPSAEQLRAFSRETRRDSFLYDHHESMWRARVRCRRSSPRASYYARVRRRLNAREKVVTPLPSDEMECER